MERRLRDIVVRALRNSALLSFLEGLETLLEGFSQVTSVPVVNSDTVSVLEATWS